MRGTGKRAAKDLSGWRKFEAHTFGKLVNKTLSESDAKDMLGWMGLAALDDITLDDFLKMLSRMKKERLSSVHNQECVDLPCLGLYLIVTSQYSSTTLYQVSYHIQ